MDLAVENFKNTLKRHGLREVYSIIQCNVILFFFPITSRTGTDIDAAMMFLDQETGKSIDAASKQVIAVVLHLTHDPDRTIPDSNHAIRRENTFAVDCLFFDDLLQCQKNTDTIAKTVNHFKRQGLTSFCCMKKWNRNLPTSTPSYAENANLIPVGGSNWFHDFIVQYKLIIGLGLVVFLIILILAITLS